jgi:hypothetical protein
MTMELGERLQLGGDFGLHDQVKEVGSISKFARSLRARGRNGYLAGPANLRPWPT